MTIINGQLNVHFKVKEFKWHFINFLCQVDIFLSDPFAGEG
jgi:hypothetical protein